MSNLIRDFVADIEIRSDGTGRTVHGILVPYNTVARVSDGGPAYEEMFVPGAFQRDIEARNGDFRGVKFLYQHNHDEPIGRAVELREDASGLFGAFRVAKTARGDEGLELLREGVLVGTCDDPSVLRLCPALTLEPERAHLLAAALDAVNVSCSSPATPSAPSGGMRSVEVSR